MANFTILEPMSTGDVIDRSVRMYRRNFVPLLSIVTVPSLIGYIAATSFWFGYTRMLLGGTEPGIPEASPIAILMLGIGLILYPVWGFTLLLTISGMTRVIGDHLMLGESITFRKCFAAARKRIGDIFLMGLLGLVILFAVYMILSVIFLLVVMIAAMLVGVTATSGLPSWLVIGLTSIAALVAIGLGITAALLIVARIVFLPQVLMIEGRTAGISLGRAMELGKGNWYRVGGIVLFTYFVSLSLLAALTLPVMAGLYFTGILTQEFMVSPTWNILYTSFSQLANLLCLPIWIISYTLLYFDSRVRKEAYDLELLAREVNPGFYWQPQRQAMVMGYHVPYANHAGVQVVQTSPLGLASWKPNPLPSTGSQPQTVKPPIHPPSLGTANDLQNVGPQPTVSEPEKLVQSMTDYSIRYCFQCGSQLEPEAGFCMRCGAKAVS